METEAETLESISIMKLKEEKDLNCSQLDATINEASLSEFQKNENQHFSPPDTVENSIQPEVATDKDTVHHFLEGKDSSFESENFLESPSLANIAVEEICRTSDDCKDKEKPILVKNEQDKVMQLESDVVEAKHRIPGSTVIDALGRQNSTATSLNSAKTEYKEVAEPSELPAEGHNVKDYMVEKLPSLPITSTLVDLSVQEGKLGGGEGEVMEERKQMTENLFNNEKNPMERVEKDDCLVENSDEQMSEAICASQSIKKEKAVSGSQKDDVEDKSSGGDPLIESGVGQTIGATPDHNHEASLVPALIKESLTNDDRSEEATKKPEVSIDKNMEAVACKGGESLIKNTESIPIEQELEKTNLHEEGIEGKQQDTSSNLLIMERSPELIIQTEEIENEKKEGDENQQASLRDTCISTATTSPGIQNGEADNLEDEESTSNKFEIPSFTTTTEEANSQTAKPEESGILEYASSFTLEAKKNAEKLKEEVCKRHEIANSNEYVDKQIIQEEEAIDDQSAVSSGEETIKCTQEDEEEEKHDVEVSEGLEVTETSKDSEGRIMEAEDVEEHSTGKQEDVEEMTMETDTNILNKEIHEKTATEDDGTIQHDSKVSDGEGTVKDNSPEDEKKAKDPVEVFEGRETAGASEDTEKQIVEDGVFTNLSTESIGEQTIKESEVKETNSTDSTQRPSTSIATEASEDIHKERNEKLVGPSLLVSEDHIEGKSVEKAKITSDKLKTESVTLVTEKTSLHQAEQEDVKLIGPSSLPYEEMKTGTTDFQALDVEEVKLEEHSKLDENANESILTTEKPDANKAEDDIKYDVIERTCVAESESGHHGIERTTGMEITASETPKDEEKDKLFECSTSASTQPKVEITEAQVKDETLMEEKIQGEKRETPMDVQEKEENFTLKEEICMFEETSKIEPEDIGKETAFEELQKQEPAEYKDAHKTVEETCIENFEQETAGELENSSSFETQLKSLDINKSEKETNDEYAREDEIEDKNEIDISEIVETRDEEVQEQSSGKGGSEVEAKEIFVNVVSERVDTAASGSVAAKDTSDNVEGAVENLQGFLEEKEGVETSEIDSTRETGPKIEVEDLTNVKVLQQNIKQVDSCEKIQNTKIEIPYKHHDESSASADKSREEIEGKNDQEEAHQVIEASKVSGSETATSEHEASGFIQTSKIECVKLEKTGDLNLKEEQDYIDAKEVTTNQEAILGKDLYISETEGVNTEERITDKDNVAKDIITVSLADEIAGQSCQEDETEQQQIVEPAPELKGEDLLHRTSDADETTTNGTRDKEVYEGCKTGDSGESKEKQLKDEDCTIKNVSAVSIEEETVDERSRAKIPKEVLEGLETANADEHIEKQIIKEDGVANDQHTVAVGEETVKERSQKDGEVEVAEKREIECEASSIIHLSEGLQEGGPSEDTSEQMIEENDDANDNSTVYAGKEEHKAGINISDIPNGEETITENPHKEEERNKQGEVKESNLIPGELSFEATDSAAKTRTVTLEDEEDTYKNSAAITVIEVSEEKQHIDNSEKLNETSSLLSEVSKEQVKEEILEQPEKTNNKLESSFITMETENISFLESELNITDLVNSTDLPSAEMNPSCPANVETSVTTLQALDVEDIKPEETSTITMETENVSLHESELEPMNLVDATDIPSGGVSPGYPANVKASATTLQALDDEDMKLEETSTITMETENVSLHESELEPMNLVDATGVSPGYPANVEASATTLQALDVEDMKLEETSFVTMETEKISLYESELETSNLVDATDIPSGGMSLGYPSNVEASAATLQALDVEDMKLEETSFVTVETEKISLHESEQETMNLVDTTNILSREMSPGCPASATTLQALDVEDIKLRETSSLAMETEKISLHESELETTSVDSTDLPSEEMNPDCPANVEASETALQTLDVEDMKLEETSSITRVSLHESELEPTDLVDSTDPPSGEMSPGGTGNVEASVTTLQAVDVEAMKLKETSNINDNANEEILAAEKPNAAEAIEGMEYNSMLEEDSGTVPVDDEQGTEAEITAKICSDDEREETLKESSTLKPQELDSTEAQEKITDQISVENETQDEKLEIPSIAQQEEEMPMQQEEEAREVEEDTKMDSEGREDEYVNELQNREGETKDKYLDPAKHILENFFVKPTQFSEYSKTEGSEPESEKGKSESEKNFDELAEEPESTDACAYVEKDILDEGRSENMKVKDEVVEDQSRQRNEVSNATMKETIIENPKAVDPTKKLTDSCESDAENQNNAKLIETKITEIEEEGNIISISVEDQIVGKNFQEEAGRKLENEDQSGKINSVNETSQGFILDAEVPREDERPEESDKIQKQIMEEEVASQELYTASVNDEAVKEVKVADVVSIKQNFQVIDSSEKTETEGAMDEKDWNKSNVSPITTESGEELPKKEGSDMLETPSVIVATEERSSEEVEPDAEKNVVVSSIGFEEKKLQTVETTETSEKDDSVNLEERFESVSQLPTFEDENRNQENLPGKKLDRDKVEEGIKDELVIASVAAPQSEGPMEHANPESDTAVVGSLTVTAEEPKQKGQQSSQLEYGEQKLEIPATEMIKDNPMIEDASQNMENTEIETTSDQNVEANKSEERELGVSAAVEERKDEVPIENETQDMKKVEVPSVPKTIEGKFPHKEEECKELKASETGSEYIEKEMQHAEHMKEENLEITPEFIFNKNDSESTDVVSFLEKETKKTEELTETTEDSEKDTLKVDKATETGLREDEPQIHPYKKSIDGVFQEPETVGASAYPGTDVLENRDISENENPEEENSEAISLVEKIGTLESKNTPKNEEDSHNINAVAEETLAGEADGECGDATNVELEKLTGNLESVTEAQIHDMLNETKTSQNSKDGAVVKDPDTVSVGDERIQEDKMADENVSKDLPKFETAENHNEKTSEANKSLGNEFAIEEVKLTVNVEKKIEEEEVANQEVVFEGSVQKPDLKFVGEETVKDSHQAGQKGEKFGDGVNPSYPTAEGTGEHIKDEASVEKILQKETEQTRNEAINQDVVCEDENTNIQIPRQGEPKVFLNDEIETAERSITASLDELDKTSNMVLQEQSQVKTDFKSETQANGNETNESTKVEDAANLNENIREMSHIQPLHKEVLVNEGATELASVAEIEKSTNTTAEEQTPREEYSTESTVEEKSTGSANNSPMPKDPIEKPFGKANAEDQKPEQALEIDSEVKGVNSTERTKGEISTGSTAISPMPMEPIEKTFGKAEAEDQKPEQTSEIESEGKRVNSTESTTEEISSYSTDISPGLMDPVEKTFGKAQVEIQKPEQISEIESEVKEVECGIEESTDEPKPSDLDKFSLSDHLQKSIKETLETVGQSGDETESKVNKEAVENKVAPNIQVENKVAPNVQVEEEKTDKHDQEDEEDEHKKSDSGSDAPVMVEASRDVEVKPAHKKSHNILSGMGSKVKHSIAKVKKAITGKSSHHKQSSSPKQESESTVTVKAAADPNL